MVLEYSFDDGDGLVYGVLKQSEKFLCVVKPLRKIFFKEFLKSSSTFFFFHLISRFPLRPNGP